MFEIGIKSAETGKKTTLGYILVGEFRENFEIDVSFWSEQKYVDSWRQCLSDVKIYGKSALITSISNPSTANFIYWWPIYAAGNKIFVQQQLFFIDDEMNFNPDMPHKFVPDRRTHNDDGDTLSEWVAASSAVSESSVRWF